MYTDPINQAPCRKLIFQMLLLLAATPKKRGMDPQNGSKRAGISFDVLNVSSCISAKCSPDFMNL